MYRNGLNKPCYALQPEGFSSQATIPVKQYTSLEEMAAVYLEEIVKFQKTGPYTVIGYSFGGLVAYEMIRQLELRGEDHANQLIIIDTLLPKNIQLNSDAEYICTFFNRELDLSLQELEKLSHEELIKFFMVKAKNSRLLFKSSSQQEAAYLFDTIKRNIALGRNYRVQPIDTQPIIILSGYVINEHQSIAQEADKWRQLLRKKVAVYRTPTTHYNILRNFKNTDIVRKIITEFIVSSKTNLCENELLT
jgi:thioesterase domain-containing protein